MKLVAVTLLFILAVAATAHKITLASVLQDILSDGMSLWDPYADVRNAGIAIYSSGNCHNRNIKTCTSLDGIRQNTINGIITLKRASGCPITITGGTEVGHASGTYSHWNGYKLDIALNTCINHYVTTAFKYIGKRGDGADQYKSASGNIYAHEGSHWDITYF
jgi:hypothetical protein